MSKDYKNPKLEEYFNKYVSLMSIDDKFKPYLVDILLRRAYQFQLTPEEIRTDVETILGSLKEIKVVKQAELVNEWAAAEYHSGEGSIKISEEIVNNSEETLYQIFTHEVYHALSRDPETMNDRLAGNINQFSGQYNSSLLETIVEKACFKTVFETKSNNIYYNNNASGYADMTFILDAIEAVYGVNEQAILRNSIQSRDNMAKFLGSCIGENKEDTLKFLDKLEMHFARLHRAMYPLPGKNDLTQDEKLEEIQRSLSDMKKVCEEKMADRIENFSIEYPNNVDLVMFDFNKLSAIFLDRANYFSNYLTSSYGISANIEEFMKKDIPLQSENKKTFNRIRQLNLVKENMSNMDPKLAEMLFDWAKYGNLQHYNQYVLVSRKLNPVFLEDMGIDFKEDYDPALANFKLDSDKLNIISKDKMDSEEYTASWDNSIAKSFKKDVKREKTKNKVKNIFNKIKNIFRRGDKNQLYLPSENETQVYHSEYSKPDFVERVDITYRPMNIGKNPSHEKVNEDLER